MTKIEITFRQVGNALEAEIATRKGSDGTELERRTADAVHGTLSRVMGPIVRFAMSNHREEQEQELRDRMNFEAQMKDPGPIRPHATNGPSAQPRRKKKAPKKEKR